MVCRLNAGGNCLAASAHMLTHLSLHVRWHICDDFWHSFESTVSEACVALSWFGPADCVETQTMVVWLPWSMGSVLAGQHRKPPIPSDQNARQHATRSQPRTVPEPDAAGVLRASLQLLPQLLRRALELDRLAPQPHQDQHFHTRPGDTVTSMGQEWLKKVVEMAMR